MRTGRPKIPVVDRLSRDTIVRESGCWEFMSCRSVGGYGKIKDDYGNTCLPHRVSWEIHRGPIPPGMLVCHKCDNPTCVNPEHLFIGTYQDNMDDRDRKGRTSRVSKNVGSSHAKAILNESDVIDIRTVAAFGATQKDLAAAFGLERSAISSVIIRRTWKHVP